MSPPREFTEAEFMIAQCARLLENQKTAFIGFGMPQVAAILAQRLQAPQLVQVFEFGAIGAEPLTPFVRNTMGGPANCYRSIAWTSMNQIFAQAYPAKGPYTLANCGPAAGSLYCTWNGQNGATIQMTVRTLTGGLPIQVQMVQFSS